jgi:GNAT superfamily N-acetyltransferase
VALINAINSLDGPPAVEMTPAVVRRDLLAPAPKAFLRVAVLDGAVRGFATARAIYEAERSAETLMLLDLYVQPGLRRLGPGRTLVTSVAAEAKRRGARCRGGASTTVMTGRRGSTKPSAPQARSDSTA